MRRPTLSCPLARYSADMKILCTAAGTNGRTMCGYQYFKRCKGWWALTDGAGRCKLRNIPEDGGNTA